MASVYWNYFISLEKDFIRTLDYVELTASNNGTYGDNFAKLLLAIGSEVDVIAKAICEGIAPNMPRQNIMHYRQVLTDNFAGMHEARIRIRRNGEELQPWLLWGDANPKSPIWWRAYNEVKHDRVVNFAQATQRNVLDALAGLLVLNMYHSRNERHPSPFPDLLDAGTPEYIIISNQPRMPGLA